MTIYKPDLHILSVWRLRLLLSAVLPSFCSAYFFASRGWLWWIFTSAWAIAFLYLYIFYYPIKFRKYFYTLNECALLLHCGVIYTRIKAIPFRGMQYTAIMSTPLERLFGVCTLLIFSAGSTARLPGLPFEQAKALQQLLSPPREGGPVDA